MMTHSFRVIDFVTGEPLKGAIFELLNCGRGSCGSISDKKGLVRLCDVEPGTYTLRQSLPPPGYRPNPAQHQVRVCEQGSMTIEKLPAEDFIFVNHRL